MIKKIMKKLFLMKQVLTEIKVLANFLGKDTVQNEVQCKFHEYCTWFR